MVISIKNMVCPRCIRTVSEVAKECGLTVVDVSLGRCEIEGTPDSESSEAAGLSSGACGRPWPH